MEIILLGIYSFFVWLIFIKFKWLPWNIYSQVTVVVIPIVALTALILSLNVFAPSSSDLRVFRYTVPIVSQVRGRVIEVPVEEGNRPVKKGDVLFRIDPTPYQLPGQHADGAARGARAPSRRRSRNLSRGRRRGVAGREERDRAGHGQDRRGDGEARPGAQARRPVSPARRCRRGIEVRSGAGRDRRQPAHGTIGSGARRRGAGPRRRGAGDGRARAGAAEARCESRRRIRGRLHRSARSSRTRNGTSTRPRRARPAIAMSSTCSCGRAVSWRPCRSRR